MLSIIGLSLCVWRHAISGEFGWTRLLDVSTGPSESFCGKEGVTRTYSFCVFLMTFV